MPGAQVGKGGGPEGPSPGFFNFLIFVMEKGGVLLGHLQLLKS